MKHIFHISFVLLPLLGGCWRDNSWDRMEYMPFRGKTLILEIWDNPDGTRTEKYRDNKGNPLSETERHYFDGTMNLEHSLTVREAALRRPSEREAPSYWLLYHYGRSPEFREWAGISLEKIRDVSLAQWRMFEVVPLEDMEEFSIRAGATQDWDEIEKISAEREAYIAEARRKLHQAMTDILSPEQIQKLLEVEWAEQTAEESSPNYHPFNPINFAMYQALTLDAEQQERLDALKTEYVQARLELDNTMFHPVQRYEKDKELKEAMLAELQDMLTETQRTKLEQLRTNTAKPARPPVEEIEEFQWERTWKPGDPIPAGKIPPRPRGALYFKDGSFFP